jgi:DNA-binding NarL/FixJ family response regulator
MKAKRVIRILLVDDHAILVDALRRQLDADAALTVVGTAASLDEARRALAELRPDVVLLDIQLGAESGLDAIREFSTILPQARIVMMSMFDQEIYRRRAFELGADAYVTKGVRLEDLRSVLTGTRRMDSAPGSDRVWLRDQGCSACLALTERELEVIHLLAEGRQIKEVADELAIGLSSVGTYLKRAMQKTGVRSRADLFRYASALGRTTGQ